MKLSIIPILLFSAILLIPTQAFAVGEFTEFSTIVTNGEFDTHTILDAEIHGQDIYMIYRLDSTSELYFISSNDKGDTWNTPILIDEVTDNSYRGFAIFVNSSDDILVVYETRLLDDVTAEINSITSTDGGSTFGSTVTFTMPTGSYFDEERVFGDGDNILFLGVEGDGSVPLWGVISNDFGASWFQNNFTDTTPLFGFEDDTLNAYEFPTAEVHGMNMYVIWNARYEEFSHEVNTHTFFSKSNDNGVTWDETVQLSVEMVNSGYDPRTFLTEDGGVLYVEWNDYDSTNMKVTSEDGGNTWSSPSIVNMYDGDVCYTTWYDTEHSGDRIIYLCTDNDDSGGWAKVSEDGGLTYSEFAYMEVTNGTEWTEYPQLHMSGDNAFFLEGDQGVGDDNIFLTYSQDGGYTWQREDFPTRNGTSIFEWEVETTATLQQAEDDLWVWFSATTEGIIEFLKADVPNSFVGGSDPNAPVIATILNQPITLIEDSEFDFTDHVVCLDDIDGDISIGMIESGDVVNTGNRGSYYTTYTCTDEASNEDTLEVHYIVKKKAGGNGGSSGSSSSGTSSGTFQQNDIPKLSDIPVLSFSDSPSQQGTPATERTNISDLFANLFDNRITEGITTPTQSQGSNPLGGSGDTTQRPNPITDFLQNLFANFFN